jgi:hypothetical protein
MCAGSVREGNGHVYLASSSRYWTNDITAPSYP